MPALLCFPPGSLGIIHPFLPPFPCRQGAVVANYPWDGTPNRTTQYWACPDDAAFKHLAKTYAKGHRTMASSKAGGAGSGSWGMG